MVFPVGLIMVVLTGADLFTSYCMYSVVALLHRRCSLLDLLKTWVVSFFGNLAGALFFMAVLTGCWFSLSATSGRSRVMLTLGRRRNIRGWCIQGRGFGVCEDESCCPSVAPDLSQRHSM
jgi:formate/nitrite transporter FocA (FNT family)